MLFGCCALLTAICFVSESFCSAIALLVILFQLFSFRVTMYIAVLALCLVKTWGIELCGAKYLEHITQFDEIIMMLLSAFLDLSLVVF